MRDRHEYQIDGKRWVVLSWKALAKSYTLNDQFMTQFHTWLLQSDRYWKLISRIYLIVSEVELLSNPKCGAAISREEFALELGITTVDLEKELGAIWAKWKSFQALKLSHMLAPKKEKKEPPKVSLPTSWVKNLSSTKELKLRKALAVAQMSEPAPVPQAPPTTDQPVEKPVEIKADTDENLLVEFGFSEEMFDGLDDPHRQWFLVRVREWLKLLRDKSASRVAIQALQKDLRLRRANIALAAIEREIYSSGDKASPVDIKRADQLRETIRETEQDYAAHMDTLQELAPWFSVTGKQITASGAIAELVKGVQEYQSKGENKILDGVFTGLEILVMTRTSKQDPEPQYRPGWVSHIIASKQWLWDATATPNFKQKDLALIDHGFKEAIRAYNEQNNVKIPDLESQGPDGEYEPLPGEPA